MPCKGICIRYKATKPPLPLTRYGVGQKRCMMCEIYTEWNGIQCPCCGSRLRTRPRNSRFRTKLKEGFVRI